MSNRTERREAVRVARKVAFEAQRAAPLISEAQLAANRANAQMSSGPVSDQGKAKSSRNALTHGLTGRTVLLPGDDHPEYERIRNVYLATFNPAEGEERRLVQSLVDCNWRLQRIQSLETGILIKGQIEFAGRYEDQPPARRAQLIDTETYLKYEKSIRNLHMQEARLVRRLEKDRAELIRLQTVRKREELLAAITRATTRTAHPATQANGFEFSTLDSLPPEALIDNSKTHKSAA